MDNLIEAWNEFIKLDKQHPSDIDDFCNGIHKVMSTCFDYKNFKTRLSRRLSS